MRVGWKMTIVVIIHDVMLDLRTKGADDMQLRRSLWERFGKIFRQGRINESDMGGTIEFKFKRCYKIQRAAP